MLLVKQVGLFSVHHKLFPIAKEKNYFSECKKNNLKKKKE